MAAESGVAKGTEERAHGRLLARNPIIKTKMYALQLKVYYKAGVLYINARKYTSHYSMLHSFKCLQKFAVDYRNGLVLLDGACCWKEKQDTPETENDSVACRSKIGHRVQ